MRLLPWRVGIQRAAAGIVVWSKNYDSSDWTAGEYNAPVARINQRQGFRFGIATLDSTPLKALLAGQIYANFSNPNRGVPKKFRLSCSNDELNDFDSQLMLVNPAFRKVQLGYAEAAIYWASALPH